MEFRRNLAEEFDLSENVDLENMMNLEMLQTAIAATSGNIKSAAF